ncbi:NUDIX domain-containing protein [Actinophytocola oryzae]|uniref:Putative NUDIX family NTP pyrophosphohydrolase n=1 Tax=Actinophytocola oryzae TaxID=502181 RepID=A0A4R7V2K5_9PSEU|nr:NUDIX domain-containing protein [Actinophytocola oryzae]TDV43583.1 putative NUDIX family NTP pyrophosphohydrolase [Actinophytocola oryzae]
MPKTSAALLLFRRRPTLEVLIAHMGGPFWARKDNGAWSIPKGEYTDEEPLAAARREFAEEMGSPAPDGTPIPLGSVRQSGGKVVTTFAVEGDFDLDEFRSNTFELEWPRGSGRMQQFPEVDRAEWVTVEVARDKLVKGQLPVLDALRDHLSDPS